jgi:hypothetical protein
VADVAGTTAAEFALVLIPLVFLLLGTINASIMMFSATALHFAAEDAARCATVNATACGTSALTTTYASSAYKGPGAPTFVPAVILDSNSHPLCNQVTGTLNYNFTTGITTTIIPISASACYPLG